MSFKKPVFDHDRKRTIAMMFGDLSMAATNIAVKEVRKVENEFINVVKADSKKNQSINISEAIETAFDLSENTQQLVACLLIIGRFQGRLQSPMGMMMAGMVTPRNENEEES